MSRLGDVVARYVDMAEGTLGLEAATPFERDVIIAMVLFSNIVLIAESYAEDGDQEAVTFLRNLWLSMPCSPAAGPKAAG